MQLTFKLLDDAISQAIKATTATNKLRFQPQSTKQNKNQILFLRIFLCDILSLLALDSPVARKSSQRNTEAAS